LAQRGDLTTKALAYLQKYFKIKVNKNAQTKTQVITPRDTTMKGDVIDYVKSDTFTPQVQRLYDYWITTYFNKEAYAGRQDLWEQMEKLYYNDSICSRKVNLMADEVVQADSNMQCIFVEGNQQQVDFILKFFDDLQIYSKIRDISVEKDLFGNHAWVLGINGDAGIDEVIPIDIYSLTERLEFHPSEVETKLLKNSNYNPYFSQDRVAQLIDAITNKDDITSVHKRYLLGFIINNYVLPPWRVLHFRNSATRSPFKPFGEPGAIHSLAPYKQWDAAMTFQVMARAASFPIDKYEITLPNQMDEAEKFNVLASFIERLDNIGVRQAKKDEKSLGDRIFTLTGVYDFKTESSDIDIGKIADIDMLKDERIIASRLPRNIIDPNDTGFGDSGISLVQKWKEFARSVFHYQHDILDNLTQLCKLQMILTNFCSIDEFDFILSMPFPESQINGDLVNNQKDTLDLFTSLTDTLSDKFLGGEKLPLELMKDILAQVLPYDQKRIDAWMDYITKAQKENEANENSDEGNTDDEFGNDSFSDDDTNSDDSDMDSETDVQDTEPDIDIDDLNFESVKKKKTKKKTKKSKLVRFHENLKQSKLKFSEAVQQEFVNVRQKKYREGVLNCKHYYSSKNNYADFSVQTLRNMDKQILQEMSKAYSVSEKDFNEDIMVELRNKKYDKAVKFFTHKSRKNKEG